MAVQDSDRGLVIVYVEGGNVVQVATDIVRRPRVIVVDLDQQAQGFNLWAGDIHVDGLPDSAKLEAVENADLWEKAERQIIADTKGGENGGGR